MSPIDSQDHLESILYHSESSEAPFLTNQYWKKRTSIFINCGLKRLKFYYISLQGTLTLRVRLFFLVYFPEAPIYSELFFCFFYSKLALATSQLSSLGEWHCIGMIGDIHKRRKNLNRNFRV